MRELPALQSVATELAPEGFALVTVGLQAGPDHLMGAVMKTALRAPVVLGDDALHEAFKVGSYPVTLIVGRDGKARALIRGAHERDALLAAFRAQL